MTEELQFICVVTLLFILGALYIMLKPDKEDNNNTQNESKNKTQNDNPVDTLNWMLANNIIDQQEYNRLIVKLMNKM